MENMELKPMPVAPKKAKTRSIVTGLMLSLALLVILNLLSNFFFYRLDLSKGKVHTLSKTSKNLVRKLNDNVVVKVYLSRNLPPDYSVLARYTKDLLGEYKQYGRNRFRYEFVSTANEDEFSGAATRSNVFTQRVMILENDQQTVRDIYMGLSFEYKGNRETLNLTKDIEGRMEYEITALLRRLTQASMPKVAVYQDSLYSAEYYKYFEHHINQNYQITPTDLTQPEMAAQVLIFPGTSDSLSAIQLYNLDQYIMHGGKVLILQDRVNGLVQYNRADEIQSNIFKFLEQYGIEIKPNLVMDQSCAPINMSQRSGIYVIDVPMPFPIIPLVQGMKSSVISRGLSDILFYLCSEINIHPRAKNITVTPLLQTSPNSGIMPGPEFDISPENYLGQKLMSTLTLPPITVSALYTGTFTSYFAKLPSVAATPGFASSTSKSEIIVVSDSDLIRDFIAGVSSTNMMFVLNAVDFLLKDVSLSEVRSRTIPNSPLEIRMWLYKMNLNPDRIAKIEPQIKQIVKGINILIPSLLLILLGLRRLIRLKKTRFAIRNRFKINKPAISEQVQIQEENPE
jgi:gliding-associated putative ABC transporter substrate-binding component GldG